MEELRRRALEECSRFYDEAECGRAVARMGERELLDCAADPLYCCLTPCRDDADACEEVEDVCHASCGDPLDELCVERCMEQLGC